MVKKISIEEHMTRYTIADNGCWHWQGYVSPTTGYGTFLQRTNGVAKTHYVHRAAYDHHNGPIPDGLVVDHTCHNTDDTCFEASECLHRRCINPDHLESVTQAVNIERGKGLAALNAAKTHCPAGHVYDIENTATFSGKRHCKTCAKAADRRHYATPHGGDKQREYARERMREVRKDPDYKEYKNRKAREAYARNKAKKRTEALSE